jgi:cellulose synthase/poly-beta-1,6-N-acetylglucosamine synthase-like glycosyltransferase
VIVPARDEERWLAATLDSVLASDPGADLVVVDNASTDATADVAREHGARVVAEPRTGIARARNTGARVAAGDVLVFLDADTPVPAAFLPRVAEAMAQPEVVAGAPAVEHAPRSTILRGYLAGWARLARARGMAQGAGQFVRRTAFDAVGGYDERIYMGEDVDLFWRLQRHAHAAGGRVVVLGDVVLRPAPRRFDAWPLWRTLVFTNPLVIRALMRSRRAWPGWYVNPPR